MNVPGSIEQRDPLPGPSASRWASVGIAGAALWILGTIGSLTCALVVVRQTEMLDPVTLSFLGLFAAGFALLAFSNWMMKLKERKELAAGYTTMAQGHYAVERCHSPTGVIVRRAGQPAQSRAQWQVAMAAVREYEQRNGHGT